MKPMTTDSSDWETLDAALDELLDAAIEDRSSILQSLRARCQSLANRAEALLNLALDDSALPSNVGDAAPDLFSELTEQDVRAHLGERLGPYRVVEIISRGGMGIVFRGERADDAFEQTVAIKVIPASIAGSSAKALFESERQYLARLEHPNIARIIDAGVTKEDTPYFIMEYIDGVTIDAYVRDVGAPRRQILDYFLQLCDAVAYCHQSMVVHGDIKPGNVLVADGRVRLVDFGIGQLLDERGREGSAKAVHAYSPQFAAPEQQRGCAATIRSDIYSLGAVLRRLLSETRVSSETAAAPPFPQDLTAIINRCLANDPGQRYEDVSALRADVRNYLDGYPVSAREPTRLYRAGKFVRRNKLLVGSTVAVLISLGVGLAAALWQYDIARTQADRAERVKDFLTSIFTQANPFVAGERDITLREVVDDAASRLDSELQELPDVRAELTQLLGNAYFGMGDYEQALTLHEEALAHWRRNGTGDDLRIVDALNAVGSDYSKRGEYTAAEALHREAIDLLSQNGLTISGIASDTWTRLGASLVQTSPRRAREIMLHAHEINLQARPGDKRALARSLGNVATGYRAERNIEQSAAYHERALAVAQSNNEKLAPEILTIRCNLALDYGTLGKHEQARTAQRVCNELTVERFGTDHPANVPNLNNLGALDIRLGQLAAAEETYVEALRIAEEKLPRLSLERMAVEINYAVVLWHSGRLEDAEKNLRDLLERMAESVGPTHSASGRIRSILGRVILERGDARTAKQLIEESLQGLTPYWRSDALLWLAEANNALGNSTEAANQARESLKLRRSIPHFTDWQIAEANLALAQATGDKQLLGQATERIRRDLPANHFRSKRQPRSGDAAN